LLAFGIDAGWDYRQDRAAEREILEDLAGQFETHVTVLGRMEQAYVSIAGAIEWLLDDSLLEPEPETTRFDSALRGVVGAPTYDFSTSVQEALVATGSLSLIRNADLRYRLTDWPRVLLETSDNELVVREYVAAVLTPFLAEHNIPIGRTFATYRGALWGLSQVAAADALPRYRALVANEEFRTLATWRYDWAVGSISNYRTAAERAREILSLIRQELE
jgi:hypothetical protein